ncbi:4'-phosphopantetheinyl transferase family protein [Pseudoalteromonas sp. S16_S37]|uniref:4'-phosphopantetheinyl transferase family protein n=1 Tax=Pseudoalteromonas sp. S16_S37 TaxID=2720228 RepID=UPI0016806812|nr:4'-phosphopantetheinyl transferase superfamily protein [Pseudoalteromonas sp. S16_S37]MBD1583964.1 4'-phosphopantetheinyl transferase superfamily protein [Pseudoalteromonas sp. S16_S37]
MKYQQVFDLKPQLNFPYFCCTFDKTQFQMSDFDTYGVQFPDKLNKAVDKRKVEYLAGRICARQALKLLGIPNVQINNGEDRAPIWPPKALGSISHTQDIAIAMVASSQQLKGLGLDIEQHMSAKQESELQKHILHPLEIAQFNALSQKISCPLSVIFSAKESIYKALYSSVKRFFGFDSAQLVNFNDNQLFFTITETLSANVPINTKVTVFYQINQHYVLTECAFEGY